MADITPVAAGVHVYSNAVVQVVRGGEAITIGQAVYKKSSDGRYYKAVSSSEAAANAKGIAIAPCPVAGDYFVIVKKGGVDLGATLVVGETYSVSGTAGGLQPNADIGTTEYVTRVGTAKDAARLEVSIVATATQRA